MMRHSFYIATLALFLIHNAFAVSNVDSLMLQVLNMGSPTDSIEQFETELDSARHVSQLCFQKMSQVEVDSIPTKLFPICRKFLNSNSNKLRHFYLGEMHFRIGQAYYEAGDERKLGLDLMELGIGYYSLEDEPNIQFELHRLFRKVEHCAIYSEFAAIDNFIVTEAQFLMDYYPRDIEVNFYKPFVLNWVKVKKDQSNFFKLLFSKFSRMEKSCTTTRKKAN